jgi:hypothetical protein
MAKANSIDEFKLRTEIKEALQGGRYMIMLTRIDETDKNKPFKHFRITSAFPREEIMPTIMNHARELELEVGLADERDGDDT